VNALATLMVTVAAGMLTSTLLLRRRERRRAREMRLAQVEG